MSSIQMRSKLSPIRQRIFQVCMLAVTMVLIPGIGFSQEPGSNPDVPLNGQGVPFDSKMNIALLVVGVLFAVYKIKQQQKKKAAMMQKTA